MGASSALTSLPPGVVGDARGSLTLMVNEIAWSSSQKEKRCCVRVKWWGEPGEGVLLWPPAESPNVAARRGSSSVTYAVTSSPEQMTRYLHDMRVLVLNLLPAPAGHTSAAMPPSLGQAYLHLALAHFEAPFCTPLSVYDQANVEVGVLSVTLLVSFGGRTPQPSLAASFDGSHLVDYTGAAAAAAAAAVPLGSCWPTSLSVASSFALNEKLALFDASLPLLPAADTTILHRHQPREQPNPKASQVKHPKATGYAAAAAPLGSEAPAPDGFHGFEGDLGDLDLGDLDLEEVFPRKSAPARLGAAPGAAPSTAPGARASSAPRHSRRDERPSHPSASGRGAAQTPPARPALITARPPLQRPPPRRWT